MEIFTIKSLGYQQTSYKNKIIAFFILCFLSVSSASSSIASDGCRQIFNPELIQESIQKLLNPAANKGIKIEVCGPTCLKIASTTDLSFKIEIDKNISKPEIITSNQTKTLTFPSKSNLNPSELNELLIYFLVGHENHPYNSPSAVSLLFKPEQERAFQAYQQAVESKSRSFLHIAPMTFGKTPVLTRALRERLNKGNKKLTIVTAHKNHLVNQLLNSVEQKLQQNPLPDNKKVHLIDWKSETEDFTKVIRSALDSPEKTVLVITTQSLKKSLSQLYQLDRRTHLLLNYGLDAIFIDEAHHLGVYETYEPVYNLFKRSGAFFYGTTSTPIHHESVLTELFKTTHWSYLEENPDLQQYNKEKVILQQLSQGIEKGEMTPFDELYIIGKEAFQTTQQEALFIEDDTKHLKENNRRRIEEENNKKVLNPLYYKRMAELMYPIIEANKKGFIVTATISEAENLSDFLNKIFKNVEFSVYHSKLKNRSNILKKSEESKGSHYIVGVAMDEGVNLPWLSAYINLNTNDSIMKMIDGLEKFLTIYPGKTMVDALFLTDYKDAQQTEELVNLFDNIKEISFKRGVRKKEDEKTSNTQNLTGVDPDFLAITRQELISLRKTLEQSIQSFWKKNKVISLSFKKLKKLLKDNNITSKPAYYSFIQNNPQYNLSRTPQKQYPKEWQEWNDFFNIKPPDFEDIQKLLKENQILTKEQYNEFRINHPELYLVQEPETFYAKDWLFIVGINNAVNPDESIKKEYHGVNGQVKFAKNFTQGDTKKAYESVKILLRKNHHFNTFDQLKWMEESIENLEHLSHLINFINNNKPSTYDKNPLMQALQIQLKLANDLVQGDMSELRFLTKKALDVASNQKGLQQKLKTDLLFSDWKQTEMSAQDIQQLIHLLKGKGESYTGDLRLKFLNDYNPENKNIQLNDLFSILKIIFTSMKIKKPKLISNKSEKLNSMTLLDALSIFSMVTEEGSIKEEYIGFKGFSKFIQEHSHFFTSTYQMTYAIQSIKKSVDTILKVISSDNINVLKWSDYGYFPEKASSITQFVSLLEALQTIEEKITNQDGSIKPQYINLPGFLDFIIKENKKIPDSIQKIKIKNLAYLFRRTNHNWLDFIIIKPTSFKKVTNSQASLSDLIILHKKEQEILSQIFKKNRSTTLYTKLKDEFINKYSGEDGLQSFLNFLMANPTSYPKNQRTFLLDKRLSDQQKNKLQWSYQEIQKLLVKESKERSKERERRAEKEEQRKKRRERREEKEEL